MNNTDEFNTKQLIGCPVTVKTKYTRITGIFHQFFERSSAVVLKDYTILKRITKKWIPGDNGDLIVIHGHEWIEIRVKKFDKVRK